MYYNCYQVSNSEEFDCDGNVGLGEHCNECVLTKFHGSMPILYPGLSHDPDDTCKGVYNKIKEWHGKLKIWKKL